MRDYRPGLSADEVMAGLRDAIRRSDRASVYVVLWLSDVIERDLYRERGCLSPHQFVRERCRFSTSRTTQMLRLARLAAELPDVRRALASGRLRWTHLRAIAPILTPSNAPRWVAIACDLPRRALEQRIAAARERSRERVRVEVGEPVQLRVGAPGPASDAVPSGPSPSPSPPPSPSIPSTPASPSDPTSAEIPAVPTSPAGGPRPCPEEVGAHPDPEVPVTVTLRLGPLQMARLETLIDALRRRGHRGAREEVLLAALELAVEGASPGEAARAAGSQPLRPRHQIVIAECPRCRGRRVAASDRPLDPATSAAVACDADRVDAGGRRHGAIPPSVRRTVLARDGHRCRAPGCGRRTLLEIHHRVPVSRGGGDDPSNLITLCHGCHRALHAMAEGKVDPLAPGCDPEPRGARRPPASGPGGRVPGGRGAGADGGGRSP